MLLGLICEMWDFESWESWEGGCGWLDVGVCGWKRKINDWVCEVYGLPLVFLFFLRRIFFHMIFSSYLFGECRGICGGSGGWGWHWFFEQRCKKNQETIMTFFSILSLFFLSFSLLVTKKNLRFFSFFCFYYFFNIIRGTSPYFTPHLSLSLALFLFLLF